MACGVHLGILLICLVQAEHARCVWLAAAQRHNSDRYVGFLQQESGERGLAGTFPQNYLRQPFVSTGAEPERSGGVRAQAADDRGFTPGLPAGDSAVSVPDAYAAHRSWQSTWESKVKRQLTNGQRDDVQNAPLLNLQNIISNGRSINNYKNHQNGPFSGKSKTWLVQQPSGYLLGNSLSAQSLPGEKQPFISAPQTKLAQRPDGPAAQRQSGSSSMRSKARLDSSTETRTLACGLGRRVSSHRHSGSPKPFRFPSHRNDPNQRKPNQSYLFLLNGGNAKERSKPPASMALDCERSPRGLSYRQNGVPPETQKTQGGLSSAPWTNRNHGVSESSGGVASSAQRYAPTTTYIIPKHLGDNAIRRLKGPADLKGAAVPQQTDALAPQEHVSPRPRVRWYRIKMPH